MVMLLGLGLAAILPAEEPAVHYLHQGVMPPGAIGSLQLQRGGPLPGFFEPVEIKAPPGVLISLATDGHFGQAHRVPLRVGLLVGRVYRIRVMHIPFHAGMEVFPTIEIINRLYVPGGQENRFAVPIEITLEDLRLALEGKFVTRVIYLEDPETALAVAEDPKGHNWFEAGPGRDPLAMADQLGRPMAILRLGARLPAQAQGPDMTFLYGCPPFKMYPSRVKIIAPPSKQPSPPPAASGEKGVTIHPLKKRKQG